MNGNTPHGNDFLPPDDQDRMQRNKSIENKNKRSLNFGLTNARSLWLKTQCLIDYMKELDLHFTVITETWFHDCPQLQDLTNELGSGSGLGMINRMRKKKSNANPGGGVSIIYNKSKITFKEHPIKRERFEIIAARGKIPHNTRPIYVIAVYISTRMRAKGYHECLALVSEAILKIKSENTNPYIALAGDFNRKDITEAIGDYQDIQLLRSGPSRGDACLDQAAASFHEELESCATHPPLTDREDRPSDHRFLIYNFRLAHTHHFKWIHYKRRKITPEGESLQASLMSKIDWNKIAPLALTLDERTAAVHNELTKIRDTCFPLKSYKYKSTNDPWIDQDTLDMIDRRKGVFEREGRKSKWRKIKETTNNMIKTRKKKYYDRECKKLVQSGSHTCLLYTSPSPRDRQKSRMPSSA